MTRSGWLYIAAGAATAVLNLPGFLVSGFDPVLYGVAALFALWGAGEAWRGPDREVRAASREALLALALLYFGFLYVYATNANIDYVQRFIRGGGNLWLAENTSRERWIAFLRSLPLLAAGAAGAAALRPRDGRWAFPAVLVGALLVAVSLPSFVRLEGIPVLAWVAFVPVLVVVRSAPYARAVLYGTIWGAFTSLLSLYWLGTFSLISLQVAIVILSVTYALFFLAAVALARAAGPFQWLAWPLLWTLFEWLRSVGFLGFPWALAAHTQHRAVGLIQLASLTGVWGVSFVVVAFNSALGETVIRLRDFSAKALRPVLVAAAAVLLVALAGRAVASAGQAALERSATMRVALVQQNTDPRRNDYDQTFATLVRLTDQAVAYDPDLVVWSETAFVPNIRRWSREDPERYAYARLVQRFLAYQKHLGRWLLTGNDDYDHFVNDQGVEIRYSYNAAVLFDDHGVRRQTYRKIRLVPFTEYFPYKDRLPGVYRMLQAFDVTLWEPGTQRTVFHHPLTTFSTPICFEDIFPQEVRGFVLAGADLIVNLSNDYWSLTPVEAAQHFAASAFRAVENRVELLRATASGLTGHVSRFGELRESLPYYQAAFMVVEVPLADHPTTLYTRWGEWFVALCAAALLGLLVAGLLARPGPE